MSLGRKHKRKPEPVLPGTVDEAVTFLIDGLSSEHRLLIQSTPREELGRKFRVWQMGIRNGLGMWGKNETLRNSIPEEHRWPDNAADYLAKLVWDRLQLPLADH